MIPDGCDGSRVASSQSRGNVRRRTERCPLSAQNRLTAEQLAALTTGDHVTIESQAEFRGPRCTSGTVTRLTDTEIVVRCSGRAGGVYVERYSRRDGTRNGRGNRAELVNAEPGQPADGAQLQAARRIDAAYRAWSRARADREALLELRAAVDDFPTPG